MNSKIEEMRITLIETAQKSNTAARHTPKSILHAKTPKK